jgi:NitT/TauT family transport system ATP-binding protein
LGGGNSAIIDLRKVSKWFAKQSGEPLTVLDNIDLSINSGEIVGLLGRSGCGKSTLLRIAGGLVRPTSGQVVYRGCPLTEPAQGIAIVFQTFALFPWLTVLDNVEAGLDALGLPRQKRANGRRKLSISSDSTAFNLPFRASFPAGCGSVLALPEP